MTDKLKPAPLAYENETFINSPDGRILRILAEYQEPLARFRREQIQDTVVFFGSARVDSRERAERALKTLRARGVSESDAQFQAELRYRAIYTRDVNLAFSAIQELEAGITYVNAPTIGAEIQLPFGGVKATGNGHREAGTSAVREFSESKSVYVDYSGKLQRAQIDVEKHGA